MARYGPALAVLAQPCKIRVQLGTLFDICSLVSKMMCHCCVSMHMEMVAMMCKPRVHMPLRNACKNCY